jgi:ribonuclease R
MTTTPPGTQARPNEERPDSLPAASDTRRRRRPTAQQDRKRRDRTSNSEAAPAHAAAVQPDTVSATVRRRGAQNVSLRSDDGTIAARANTVALRPFLDGDRVDVAVRIDRGARVPTAVSVKLTARSRRVVIGAIVACDNGTWAVEPDPTLGDQYMFGRGKRPGAPGEIVAVSITSSGKRPRVAEVVGASMAASSPEHLRALALVRALGDIDPAVGSESDRDGAHRRLLHALGRGEAPSVEPDGPSSIERIDLRDLATVTIDGPQTRDIDDAIDAALTEHNSVVVTVHIADVASKVPSGSELDTWARWASTSVYLPDQVIPMLPAELSEDSCSLIPGCDRDTLSVTFHVLPDGSIDNVQVAATRIRSKSRLTYDQVDDYLDGDDEAVDAAVRATVDAAATAARYLAGPRDDADLLADLMSGPEFEPQFGDHGIAIEHTEPRTFSHRLIEELMIAANEQIGLWLAARSSPSLYRTQTEPDTGLLERISAMDALYRDPAASFSVEPSDGDSTSHSPVDAVAIAHALAGVHRTASGGAREQVRRSLARALYQHAPGNHFRLGTSHYLHFTSPIRRYADLLVHRAVHAALAGGSTPYSITELTELATWISERSKRASYAEGDCRRQMWAHHLNDKDQARDQLEARVINLHPLGATVRWEAGGLTGLVHRRHFGRDWTTDVSKLAARCASGPDTRYVRVGQLLSVRVESCEPTAGSFEFAPSNR